MDFWRERQTHWPLRHLNLNCFPFTQIIKVIWFGQCASAIAVFFNAVQVSPLSEVGSKTPEQGSQANPQEHKLCCLSRTLLTVTRELRSITCGEDEVHRSLVLIQATMNSSQIEVDCDNCAKVDFLRKSNLQQIGYCQTGLTNLSRQWYHRIAKSLCCQLIKRYSGLRRTDPVGSVCGHAGRI